MELTKIVVVALLVGLAACSRQCYPENKWEEEAHKMLKRFRQPHIPHHHAAAADRSSDGCPVEHYREAVAVSERSLSPWEYVHVERDDLFPSSYMEARCLCRGCIVNRVENHNYNSINLTQSWLFVKRTRCQGGHSGTTYSLETVTVHVAVGCTCVRPRASS